MINEYNASAVANMSSQEAVTLAVQALADCATIVPSNINEEETSESEEDEVQTTAPVFVKKLQAMVNDPEIDSAVWAEDGTSFVIHQPKRLSEQLAKYFKSSKLKSFVRQLHFYGFKKVGGSRYEDWVYNHKFFQRHGRLIHKLRRKTCGPDQQIKNLQLKVDSLQGSLNNTQQKLGDMAVALMALLQHHNAATFLGTSTASTRGGGGNAPNVLPAKRGRARSTNLTKYEQQSFKHTRSSSRGQLQAPTTIVKQEPGPNIPASLRYNDTLDVNGDNQSTFNSPRLLMDLDFEGVDDLLFSPGHEDFGYSEVDRGMSNLAMTVPVTA